MKYMKIVCTPLIAGYSLYSLVYHCKSDFIKDVLYNCIYLAHKGWYGWILGSLTGVVYAFGFIMMTPQLFINYKLKSVAHLPWKTLVYRALNTFIDDLFAFIIYMPTMHRLSCFRDDVIFIIYMYQRWIYPVDKRRQRSSSSDTHEQVCEPQHFHTD